MPSILPESISTRASKLLIPQIMGFMLWLICIGNHRLNIAIRDYYRAFSQRANWIRDDLLYINELEKYEQQLIDEWEHHFASMEDELSILGTQATEEAKVKYGKTLFKEIESGDIRIRPKVQNPFIMRGSYHILANQLKIGSKAESFQANAAGESMSISSS